VKSWNGRNMVAVKAADRRMSAARFLEAVAQREFDRFFERSGITIEPVTLEQARIARQAYRDFGKGCYRAGF